MPLIHLWARFTTSTDKSSVLLNLRARQQFAKYLGWKTPAPSCTVWFKLRPLGGPRC